jgi:hypothetical protein
VTGTVVLGIGTGVLRLGAAVFVLGAAVLGLGTGVLGIGMNGIWFGTGGLGKNGFGMSGLGTGDLMPFDMKTPSITVLLGNLTTLFGKINLPRSELPGILAGIGASDDIYVNAFLEVSLVLLLSKREWLPVPIGCMVCTIGGCGT